MGDPGLGVSRPSNDVTARINSGSDSLVWYPTCSQLNSITKDQGEYFIKLGLACYLANLCPLVLCTRLCLSKRSNSEQWYTVL